MKKLLSFALRAAITVGCLAYALWGVDLKGLVDALAGMRLWAVACFALGCMVTVGLGALRLRFIVAKRIGAGDGYKAVLLGLSLNNILPARLGEMAKAFYLRRQAGISLSQALESVFWERFADLNALLLLGVIVAVVMGQGLVLYPLMAVVGGMWIFLVLARIKPRAALSLVKLIPAERLRLLFAEMVTLIEAKMRGSFLPRLAVWTMAAWTSYILLFGVGLFGMTGMPGDFTLLVVVFTVVTLGFAVPAAPGGMGVYEAAFVLSLGWFGVDKDKAFAVGLAMHMLQYLPVTVAGLVVMSVSGLSLKDLREDRDQV